MAFRVEGLGVRVEEGWGARGVEGFQGLGDWEALTP